MAIIGFEKIDITFGQQGSGAACAISNCICDFVPLEGTVASGTSPIRQLVYPHIFESRSCFDVGSCWAWQS